MKTFNQKIKWGILGTSSISTVMANAIQQSENSELLAIASRDLNKAINFAKKHSIKRYYADYQHLLHDDDIDIVYIGLPNHVHKEWIIRSAEAGKHILCEKPFVLSVREANEALNAVKKNKVFCMEALMYRFHPFIDYLQNLITSKTIGEIQSICAAYTVNIADLANKTASGAIRSLGCYPLSLVRLLLKEEPTHWVALGACDQLNMNDHVSSAIFQFEKGITATITTSDTLDWWWQFTILGTEGHLNIITNPWLPSQYNQITVKKNGHEQQLDCYAEKPLYTYQIDYVANQIKNNVTLPDTSGITWEHSLGNIRILDAWQARIKNPVLGDILRTSLNETVST